MYSVLIMLYMVIDYFCSVLINTISIYIDQAYENGKQYTSRNTINTK